MTIREILKSAKIPKNELEIFLANILNKKRSWLLSHSENEISESDEIMMKEYEQRRIINEPIAYIIGKKEFFGRDFIVNKNVLIPRPSTEYLIQAVGDFLNHKEKDKYDADTEIIIKTERYLEDNAEIIVDIGTGSGCIAITLALEHPKINVIATDISEEALKVANSNIEKYDLESKVLLRKGSLLDPIIGLNKPFLLVSNPPYIPNEEELMDDVKLYEPNLALRGGDNGGEIVEELIQQSKKTEYCIGVCIECRIDQIQ